MSLQFNIASKKGALSEKENFDLDNVRNRADMNDVIGRRVAQGIAKHFRTYSAEHPNKFNANRTNYVARMGDATSHTFDSTGAKVIVAHEGARLRIEGGTIKPITRKYLTIPAIAAAYGKRAGEFNNLSLMFKRAQGGKAEAFALGVNPYTPVGKGAPKRKGTIKKQGKDSRQIMFWLVKSANIPGNRNLLPTDDEILQLALDGTKAFLNSKGGASAARA